MIRPCDERDFDSIWSIINDGAQVYRGVIPADCWTDPYMSMDDLCGEIDSGVTFWGYEDSGTLLGVMGIQRLADVTLIRHAYVRTGAQGRGIGSTLLSHLEQVADGPVLIGTWGDAPKDISEASRSGSRQLPSASGIRNARMRCRFART
jgi:GNAT superfamily N-acetyltransferase